MTLLADHEESNDVAACGFSTDLCGGMLCRLNLGQLFRHASCLIRIQSEFNPHPEVGYVIQTRMRVNAFTPMQISLTRIPTRVKRYV